MAGQILWASGAIASVAVQASGQGQQLSNAVAVALTTDFDNRGLSGGPSFFADIQFQAAQSGFGAALNDGQALNFYMVPASYTTPTVFPNVDVSTGRVPANSFKGSFVTTVSGNQQLIACIEGVPLMPVAYRCYLLNSTGQTLASGWGVYLDMYQQYYT